MTRTEVRYCKEEWRQAVFEVYSEYESESTFIATYKHNDLYIVHGELKVVCFDSRYDMLWEFSARDIFVLPDGSCAFEMKEDGIWLKDWLGYSYLIGYDGKCIKYIGP